MRFPDDDEPDNLLWWEMIAEYPELGEELEEFGKDPEAGVVAAVGIFTMLKIRFWERFSRAVPEFPTQEHRSDDSPPPQAGGEDFNFTP